MALSRTRFSQLTCLLIARLKGTLIWLLLVAVAMGNGIFHDTVRCRV
jgi:hypothetical protein